MGGGGEQAKRVRAGRREETRGARFMLSHRPTTPEWSTSGFHRPGRHYLLHARSALRRSVSRTKVHPVNPFRASEPLPILNPSDFVPKNGFPVVKGLRPIFWGRAGLRTLRELSYVRTTAAYYFLFFFYTGAPSLPETAMGIVL